MMIFLKIMCSLLVLLVFTAMPSEAGPSRGALNAPTGMGIATPTPMDTATKPLKNILLFKQAPTSSQCQTVPEAIDEVITRNNEVTAMGGKQRISSTMLQSYKNAINQQCCSPQASFTVPEQQAAGCKGSDTLAQCMIKLTQKCIKDQTGASINNALISGRMAIAGDTDRLKETLQKTNSLMILVGDLLTAVH